MLPSNAHRRFFRLFLTLTALPVLGVVALNAVVDPFDLNQAVPLGLEKDPVASRANSKLLKLARYNRDPAPNILIGDCRIYALDPGYIETLTGRRYANLGLGGATLYEMIDTFWFAARRTKLERVVLGLNFLDYNAARRTNQIPELEAVTRSPLKYYLSPFTTKISLFTLSYHFQRKNPIPSMPLADAEAQWRFLLADVPYGRYQRPDDAMAELRRIRRYCEAEGIELRFVIPPTHVDMQKRVDDFGLRGEFDRYKKEFSAIAPTVDFDFPSPLTTDRALYATPYQYHRPVVEAISDELWGNKPRYGKRLSK